MLEWPSDRGDYRAERLPHTVSPHLFISHKSAYNKRPVTDTQVAVVLWMCATAVCEDRILQELHPPAATCDACATCPV